MVHAGGALQHAPIVTVRAFVPPQGAAARALPTVPVLAIPSSASNGVHAVSRPVLAATNPAVAVPVQAVKGTSKLDAEGGSDESQEALSTQSMEELYREVQELEQQERRAMATRAAALQKAMAGTSNCNAGDAACGQAHLDVNWKTAKDKYEQASIALEKIWAIYIDGGNCPYVARIRDPIVGWHCSVQWFIRELLHDPFTMGKDIQARSASAILAGDDRGAMAHCQVIMRGGYRPPSTT